MTIDFKVIVGKNLSQREQKKVEQILAKTFSEIDAIYNKWNPESELSQLNLLSASISVDISKELESFLQETDRLVKLTKGRFDPTIEPLQQLWKKHLEKGKTPSDEALSKIIPAIGWDKIHFGNGTFSKGHDLTQLDLGGIAKGYCVDLIVERLKSAGYPNVFVEWGGEIRASGEHPDHRPWNVFISRLGDPNPDHAIAQISLNNQAIASSGDYLQNWTVEEKITYTHIIDPFECAPLEVGGERVASASVLAPNCMLADTLATTLMLFPTISQAEQFAEEMKEQNPKLSFWLMSRS